MKLKNELEFKTVLEGVAMADALGVPFENLKLGKYDKVEEMQDSFVKRHEKYDPHGQPEGSWSDDTSLTLVLMEYLNTVDYQKGNPVAGNTVDFMENRRKWLIDGEFTPLGETFGTGSTTRESVKNFIDGLSPEKCGLTDDKNNGNGTLMTLSALAFWAAEKEMDCYDLFAHLEFILQTSHNTALNAHICYLYLLILQLKFEGARLETAISSGIKFYRAMDREDKLPVLSDDMRLLVESSINKIKTNNFGEIQTSGFVVHSFEAAMYCVLNSKTYKECTIKAVNLGGDVDSIAAIAAPLAVANWGLGDVDSWKNKLKGVDVLNKYINKFQ